MLVRKKSEVAAYEEAQGHHKRAVAVHAKGVSEVQRENRRLKKEHELATDGVKALNVSIQERHEERMRGHAEAVEWHAQETAKIEQDKKDAEKRAQNPVRQVLRALKLQGEERVALLGEPPQKPVKPDTIPLPVLTTVPEPSKLLDPTWPEPTVFKAVLVRETQEVKTSHGTAIAQEGQYAMMVGDKIDHLTTQDALETEYVSVH